MVAINKIANIINVTQTMSSFKVYTHQKAATLHDKVGRQ